MNAFETTVPADAATTEAAVRDALGAPGFGVVSDIDVAANLKNALGVDRPALKILGACSPVLVQQALAIDSSIALLLPCNVVLDQADGGTRVRIPLTGISGRTVYHCHILDHEDLGMMGVIKVA